MLPASRGCQVRPKRSRGAASIARRSAAAAAASTAAASTGAAAARTAAAAGARAAIRRARLREQLACVGVERQRGADTEDRGEQREVAAALVRLERGGAILQAGEER